MAIAAEPVPVPPTLPLVGMRQHHFNHTRHEPGWFFGVDAPPRVPPNCGIIRRTHMNTLRFPALRRLAALAVLGILLTVGVSRSHAQINIYARFANGTGSWAGESTDPGRTGWVNLRSVNFGTAVTVTFSGGTTVSPPTFDKCRPRQGGGPPHPADFCGAELPAFPSMAGRAWRT